MSDINRHDAGPRMSGAVVHAGVAYLSGQVALDAAGQSVTAQTQNILDRIDALLAKSGTDKTRLLSASIWLSDIGTFNEMNAAWEAWVDPKQPPARATVESRLAADDILVEIQVQALV